jgi:hypothetical protein
MRTRTASLSPGLRDHLRPPKQCVVDGTRPPVKVVVVATLAIVCHMFRFQCLSVGIDVGGKSKTNFEARGLQSRCLHGSARRESFQQARTALHRP